MTRTRIAVVGVGAVGARAARQLLSTEGVDEVLLRDTDEERLAAVASSLGSGARADPPPWAGAPEAGGVILATPSAHQASLAREALGAGLPVVATADALDDVRRLLELDEEARVRELPVVVGAGFGPGLSCVLAVHAAALLDVVEEIHLARVGTGGPACARQHHRALGGEALDWRDQRWVERRGGSGRELCWFPEPVGAADCYRAALPDALLLVRQLPSAERITARVAANRRDRLFGRLPQLWPTHGEGGPGAVRIEVRGRRGTAREVHVYGAMDRPAVAAGAVAAVTAHWATQNRLQATGAAGLAAFVEPVPFLHELRRRGVRVAVFEGTATSEVA